MDIRYGKKERKKKKGKKEILSIFNDKKIYKVMRTGNIKLTSSKKKKKSLEKKNKKGKCNKNKLLITIIRLNKKVFLFSLYLRYLSAYRSVAPQDTLGENG